VEIRSVYPASTPSVYIYMLPCFPNLTYKFLYQQNQLGRSRCEGSNVAFTSRRIYRQTSSIGNRVLRLKICVCRWKVIYGSVIRDMKACPASSKRER